MKHTSFLFALTALLLAACAPATPPPADPAQVQAFANTMVAQTEAAIPTRTPTPLPSATPLPSPTPLPPPTLVPEASPTVASSGSGARSEACNGMLSSSPKGPLTTMKIVNANKAPVTVSLYLSKTSFGECGYRAYTLGPMDSVYDATTLPQGCYTAFALVNDPKKPSTASSVGAMCPNNDDKWTMVIQAEVIKFYSP
ncbi:MAG TPA: hypothetical protein VMJ64_18775 [Anaerolineales bacterium]|nr:hypothetical protein [Anaerolineales bacterium]